MTDPLTRLAKSDPTRAFAEPEPDMVLFERLVATPPAPPRAPRTNARRALVGGVAAIAVAVAIVVFSGLGSAGGGRLDLGAKSDAEAAADSDVVTHSISVSKQVVRLMHPRPGGRRIWRTTTRQERWRYHDRSHTIITANGETYDQVLGADGVLRNRLPSGRTQTMHAGRPGEGSEIVGSAKTDPVAAFRQQFAGGHLRAASPARFAGRATRTYQRTTAIALPRGRGRQITTETFYLTVPAGVPLGVRVHVVNPTTTFDEITTLTRFEHLPATAANLAHVAG
jgi:hypothetical protein